MNYKLVCATTKKEKDFFELTPTGRSLRLFRSIDLSLQVFFENKLGLPIVYNKALKESKGREEIIIFIHDDVHLIDYYWLSRLHFALEIFDLVGVAGNKRRVMNQPSWAFVDPSLRWDERENLSGVVAHGNGYPPDAISVYGPTLVEVKLLDGVILAAKSENLIINKINFDEQFDFHFYDLDLCRQIESKGMTCGTCDLSLIHESGGQFGSNAWKSNYEKYIAKWRG